ncbi:Rieske (2Fe-2S) protein, partial [Streptomyces sp. SID8455]|nr:Rieske (2Fe-2S) protein [Streptomyces sp. SID8455]
MTENRSDEVARGRPREHRNPLPGLPDLRRVGANPDFWYPVALSRGVRSGRVAATAFAGERIALFRGRSGAVHALEDRCAHRQVPLSMGVVDGETLRC